MFALNAAVSQSFLDFNTPILSLRHDNNTKGTGIYVPLYSYPTSTEWIQAATIKQLFPNLTFLSCVNPSNGPGDHFDKNFASGIKSLSSAGILLGGYVATDYGLKPQSDVIKEITKYKTWYGNIHGICFDEMQSKKGKEQYYKNLTDFAKNVGFNFTVGNPGTDISPTYIGTVDFLKIYEGSGTPGLSSLKGWHLNYDKKNFITIAYNVPTLNYTYLTEETKYVGLLYVTDDTLPNPYDKLPYYLYDLARFLNSSSESSLDSHTPVG